MRATCPFLQPLARAVSLLFPAPLCPPLHAARVELCRSLQLAFRLATTQCRAVVLEPRGRAPEGRIPITLPEGVCWGRPTGIPLPPSLEDSGWRGGRPRPITVMPHRRAATNVWFLHHGRQTLCLRLELSGSVELLRYRPFLGAWVAC